jgi:hypothetical protein
MFDTAMVNYINKEITNKQICDAIGCLQEATKEIVIDAGKFGSISLSVCANCISKFVTS